MVLCTSEKLMPALESPSVSIQRITKRSPRLRVRLSMGSVMVIVGGSLAGVGSPRMKIADGTDEQATTATATSIAKEPSKRRPVMIRLEPIMEYAPLFEGKRTRDPRLDRHDPRGGIHYLRAAPRGVTNQVKD